MTLYNVQVCNEVAAEVPTDERVLSTLAHLCRKLNKLVLVREVLEKATAADAKNVDLLRGLFGAYARYASRKHEIGNLVWCLCTDALNACPVEKASLLSSNKWQASCNVSRVQRSPTFGGSSAASYSRRVQPSRVMQLCCLPCMVCSLTRCELAAQYGAVLASRARWRFLQHQRLLIFHSVMGLSILVPEQAPKHRFLHSSCLSLQRE